MLAEIADAARGFDPAAPPALIGVTSLAEGADQMFAAAALDQGYRLLCPFPFPQAEFERDFAPPKAFAPDALAQFRGLIARAAAGAGVEPIEMPGLRADEGGAYAAAGGWLVERSDLIVAVWDGGPAAGAGGTAQSVALALDLGSPVLRLDPARPERWTRLAPRRPPAGTSAQALRLAHVLGRLALDTQPDDP